MRVHFYIRYHTKFGESLWVSGNTGQLGNKNKAHLVPMQYLSDDYWKLELEIPCSEVENGLLEYKYFFKGGNEELISEYGYDRIVDLNGDAGSVLKLYDVWNFSGEYDNVFFTEPFTKTLLPRAPIVKTGALTEYSHIFKVKAPLLKKNEVVCLCGDGPLLKDWDTSSPLLLQKQGDWWLVQADLRAAQFPLAYKYGVFNIKENKFVAFENGSNRTCFEPAAREEKLILHDGFINMANDTFKGAGVAIPVFSLRTKNGLGVGEFNDLKLLVDWAKKTGLKLIQLLPVNDTTATFTWRDSYPYAAISAFALHPLFLNIATVAGNKHKALTESLREKQHALNALPDVDYEQVLQLKLSVLQQIFNENAKDIFEDADHREFLNANEKWLKPYAAFCYLRDKYKTADASKWKTHSVYSEKEVEKFFDGRSPAFKKVGFYCWLQYHLHLQLKAAVDYAHKAGVVIKGDVPIGVYRYGCDAWMAPQLYKMEMQAGAPPDNFAATGQNWGFPTYNWQRMQKDGFAWWRQRFEQMSHYFDAFRIDHILGFFRIWSIPLHAVQGIMGRFDACLPVHRNEFGENGIWFDADRFCKPYITGRVLAEIFGDDADRIKSEFLQKSGPDTFSMAPEFDTQRKVEAWFAKKEESGENEWLKNRLYDLISNVILFEVEGSGESEFHFRIAVDHTLSFRYLPEDTKNRVWQLYIHYFFKRQDHFWQSEGLKKLPGLKEATNMLVCGEDLGMVPECVPQVMRQLGILSLEIQRMPKQSGREFFNPKDAPYLSVVTPSTHDMSTVRGWWQENRESTRRFYNSQLGQGGEAPYFCEPWINRAIVLQHLYSPAMWSIFQIQDLLGMSSELRREMPEEERINIPADPKHYWRYRMHINLEQLLEEDVFNNELKGYVVNSGRG